MSDDKSNLPSPVDSVHSDIHCWYDRMTFFHSLDDDSHGPNLQLSGDNSVSSSNSNLNSVDVGDETNNNHNNNRIIEDVEENDNENENEVAEHRFQIQEENELNIDEEFWRNYRERKNRWNRIPIRRRNPPPHWTR